MKVTYIKNLNQSFMVVKDADFEYENFELLMLLNNKIPGLLEVQIIIGDGKIEYWYDITGMTALDTMLDLYPLDEARIRKLTEDLYDMNMKLDEYLLDGGNICYLPEMLYMDRTAGKYKFCYLPGSKAAGNMGLQTLTEYMLTKIDHTDRNAVKIGYALYDKSTQECCCVRELLACADIPRTSEKACVSRETQELWDSEETEDCEENSSERIGFGGVKKWFRKRKKDWEKGYQEPCLREKADYETEMFFGSTGRPDDPTVFLKAQQNLILGRLLYQGKNGEGDFILEDESFVIGKEREKADGVLKADTVSRMHAKITKKEGEYYLEDLNSTNGTYLNGRELNYHEPVKLSRNDRICFATEEYIFC